jgi:hypothetical protein
MEETFLELSIKKFEHLNQNQDNKDHFIYCDEINLIQDKQKYLSCFKYISKLLLEVGKITSNFSRFDEFTTKLTKKLIIGLISSERETIICEIKCLFLLQEIEISDIVRDFLNEIK